ncbi:tetratricopeptide repeat protein [Streptomyces chiangmaiensis]
MLQITLRRARRELVRAEDALARGDQGGAMVAYEEAFKQATRHAPSADSPEAGVAATAQIGLGRLCLHSGQYDIAQLHFGQAMTLCPGDPAGLYWAGCAAAHSSQHLSADAYFTHVLARNPGEPRALVQRAYVRLLRGDPVAARADLLVAVGSEPPLETRLVLALLQLQAGDWAGAKELLADPGAADSVVGLGVPHRVLALALEGTGEAADALQAYARALALDGDRAPDGALYRHGALAYRLGRFDECTRMWRALHRRHPEDPRTSSLVAHALYAQAWDRLRRKDFAGAVQCLDDRDMQDGHFDDELVELHLYAAVKESTGYAESAGPAQEQERSQRVREHLQAACELRPTDVRVLRHLGLLEYRDGHRRQAEALWRRVLRTQPGELRARYALALARIESEGGTAAATAELAALVDAADRAGDTELTGRAATSLAAVRIRAGDWAGAGDALLPHPGGPGCDTLLGEALYRAGNPQGAPPSALGHWQSVAAGIDRGNSDEDPRVRRERELRARKVQLGAALLALGDSSGPAGEIKAPDWTLVVEQSTLTEVSPGGLEAAVLLHLGGHTRQAREELLHTWRANPSDPRTARTIGLALLGTLLDGGLPEAEADTAWRQCLAAWGAALASREAWAEFLEDAEHRYGKSVPDTERIKVAQALKSYLAGQLPETSPRDPRCRCCSSARPSPLSPSLGSAVSVYAVVRSPAARSAWPN